MTLHDNTLPGTTAETLETLGSSGLFRAAYLAGGTAAALQLGHRISHDLDFFTAEAFDEHTMVQSLEKLGLQRDQMDWRTIIGTFRDVHFSCFYYEYPLLFTTIPYRGIALADLRDIAAMKVDAIATRGVQRDFVDLYAILRACDLSLMDVVKFYKKKYDIRPDTLVHTEKSMAFFDDAEGPQDRPLELLQPIDWEEVKQFFRDEVERTSWSLLTGES